MLLRTMAPKSGTRPRKRLQRQLGCGFQANKPVETGRGNGKRSGMRPQDRTRSRKTTRSRLVRKMFLPLRNQNAFMTWKASPQSLGHVICSVKQCLLISFPLPSFRSHAFCHTALVATDAPATCVFLYLPHMCDITPAEKNCRRSIFVASSFDVGPNCRWNSSTLFCNFGASHALKGRVSIL